MQKVPADLFVLLGLSPGVGVDRLRLAYEGAVASASSRGDFRRVHELSTAFDMLSAGQRRAVYSGQGAQARRWDAEAAPAGRTGAADARRARRGARDAALTARWRMRRPYRIVVRLIVSVVVAFQVLAIAQHQHVRQAWPVLAAAAGCAFAGWVGWAVVNRVRRGGSSRAVEVVAWSIVVGLSAFIGVLALADGAFA